MAVPSPDMTWGNVPEHLPHDEQRELARRYQAGDRAAGDRLVRTNLKLAYSWARRMHRRGGGSLEDLIQAACIGLVRAAQCYDPDEEATFYTYAYSAVRNHTERQADFERGPVRCHTTQDGRRLTRKMRRVRRKLALSGVEPTHAAVAEAMDIDEAEVERVSMIVYSNPVSLDIPLAGDTEVTGRDLLACGRPCAESLARRAEVRDALAAFGRTLRDKRERDIFKRRIAAIEPVTLAEVGERWGVSKQRIQQVEAGIIDRLKGYLSDHRITGAA